MIDTATHEHGLSPVLLSGLAEFIAQRMGLHFPKERSRDLERGINSAAREFGFRSAEACIQWLMSTILSKTEIETLASHLTVGETYFFRDKKTFEALEDRILPELIRSRSEKEKYLRIWSAGCATGEEPYSIAMLLDKNIPHIEDWNITILATDINPRFLQKAKAGIYGEWSFRDTPGWVKEGYFRKMKAGFELNEHIKEMITFSYHNLIEDTYPLLLNNTNAMDIIFCRNVMMYFSPERAAEVAGRLYRCLVDRGWLIVSPVETSSIAFSQFETVNLPGVILYRKNVAGYGFEGTAEIPYPSSQGKTEEIPVRSAIEITPPPSALPLSALRRIRRGEKIKGGRGSYDADKGESQEELTAGEMSVMARSYANQGRLSDAIQWCEKAIASDKLNPALYYLRATIQQELGQSEKAVLSLRQAIYLDQNFVIAHFALGNLMRQLGRSKESEKIFKNVLSLLKAYGHDDVLPESEGMLAGRMMEIIERLMTGDLKGGL